MDLGEIIRRQQRELGRERADRGDGRGEPLSDRRLAQHITEVTGSRFGHHTIGRWKSGERQVPDSAVLRLFAAGAYTAEHPPRELYVELSQAVGRRIVPDDEKLGDVPGWDELDVDERRPIAEMVRMLVRAKRAASTTIEGPSDDGDNGGDVQV